MAGNTEPIPLLLDTDIGSNVDDAIALAYLLAQPRCELLGITTVSGEPQVRAQLADAVCRAFGRCEVAIHSGAAKPLIASQAQPEAPQKAVLPHHRHREDFDANTAVDFLRDVIRSRPGEITLLSIGPLTNVGLLFALHPEIPSLLKQHVMMGGSYFSRPAGYGLRETNIMGDPHASVIVFAANTPATRCFGLDVTTKCRMPREDFRQRFGRDRLEIVGEMAETWFGRRAHVTFHDPLAAAGVFDPDLCSYEAGLVQIELHSSRLIGRTHFRTGAASQPHEVAAGVHSELFFKHFFDVLESESA